ncbi:D-alanyl-D-alanine carboxypeptidase/D-alanyl-D-alanine-endopeptidase [Corynebacterium kutscheri]|uniref:D-alanyl-D-alanine carboxypeptidase/D-alanyl-D-alanine-endopeptidase n=1 Tax=Corynebacterium kutscheri TaxID=35755 RepID=UPI0037C1560C
MKNTKWIAAIVAVLGIVVVVVYVALDNRLQHDPAQELPRPVRTMRNLIPLPGNNTGLSTSLSAFSSDTRLGTFSAVVIDTTTGETVFSQLPTAPLRPASATKALTATAALYQLDAQQQIETTVYLVDKHTAVIKATGDVWLTHERLSELAQQLPPGIDEVLVDTSAWADYPSFAVGWDEADIDAGYIAPMEPIMLYGGRIGETSGDAPRSHTPAFAVAEELAALIGATKVGPGVAPADAEPVASTLSPPLIERITMMMVDSDNVMAEAIGRESAANSVNVLATQGFAVGETSVVDYSGLSVDNVVTAQLLAEIMHRAATESTLRPLLSTLPVAGGNGTLAQRYLDVDSRGYVRAKTGTLTQTSALAGIVQAKNEHVYAIGLISNDSDILSARAALDEFATTIYDFLA